MLLGRAKPWKADRMSQAESQANETAQRQQPNHERISARCVSSTYRTAILSAFVHLLDFSRLRGHVHHSWVSLESRAASDRTAFTGRLKPNRETGATQNHTEKRTLLTKLPYSAFIAGGIAACGAVTATHPFETVKIRMQLQGELQNKGHSPHFYKGPIHGVGVIVKNEGIRGIYRGIGCAYVYQILLNGCRLGFYEPMRQGLTSLFMRDGSLQNPAINMFCGAASGVLGAAAGSPFFLVKTRLQSYSPFLPVGTQHTYKNALDGLSQIYRAEGVRGLYRGVGAAMIRTGFGSSVQLPTYFFAKRRLMNAGMEEGPALHLSSSAVSGFVVCCFMHPPGRRHIPDDASVYKES